ncbi:hypothetical protein [Falsiroseomonas sp.]|uniref:hypothetical protein n=1 Tax=Falsiroseomonas sp. TaxID=2870721 RepID=UPI00271870A0|nr:hypothetical protein [Falsiroseomonas sp.]MDO9502766.1 hypothetical protein [Falsiroseomonas sp.]
MEAVGLETRWIIIGTDGRHVTLGRHTDPSPDEITQAEAGLAAQGLAGWLAVMKGGYYTRRKPSLMMVRPLCDPQTPFAEAVDAFQAARVATLNGLK